MVRRTVQTHMENGDTDAILVARVRRGDSRAFELLVRRHLRAAHAVARARLDNPADADDACQDAFIRALERIDDCRNPEGFRGWLLAIVRNTAHNLRDYERLRAATPIDMAVPAASHDPFAEARNAELRSHLAEAMQHLTELQRKVLILYDFEGWKHSEIARKLGISAGSSRVHLHVARKAMRKRLSGRLALGSL